MKPKILTFAGPTRIDSLNKKLIQKANPLLKEAGCDVTSIDLRDFPLPLYDGDLEKNEGIPENAMKLKKLFMDHQGMVISSGEYNSSIPAVLKNMIDWVSRPHPSEEEYLICFKNKLILLLSASPGELGGLRALVVVRMLFENIGSLVFPKQFALPFADKTIDDPEKLDRLKKLIPSYAQMVQKII